MPNPVWFPNGLSKDRYTVELSPVTQPRAIHGPDNVQLFQQPTDPPRQQDEQGLGRSPGQQWPHMPHVEQFSFESLNHAPNPPLIVPTERQGWSAPVYYEQYPNAHFPFPVPIAIANAPSMSYTDINEVD